MAEAWISPSAEQRESSMVPWANPTSYTFSRASVLLNAPERSGVYVLHSKTTWVYIGEGENIREQLLQHLDGPKRLHLRDPGPDLQLRAHSFPEASLAARRAGQRTSSDLQSVGALNPTPSILPVSR